MSEIINVSASFPVMSPVHKLGELWDGTNWDGDNWMLMEDWRCHIQANSYEFEIFIKKYFVTDGGSIPKWFQNVFSPLDKYFLGYLIHDGFYGSQLVERLRADNILFDILEKQGMAWLGRNQIYSAVRIGGDFAWDNKTELSVKLAKQLVSCNFIKDFTDRAMPRISNGVPAR